MITSFGMQDVICRKFVPEGRTINREFCCQVRESLLKRISIVQPHFREHCCFCTTVPPPHCITRLKCCLANRGVMESSHPPHSPDLYQLAFCTALSENCSERKTISGPRGHQEECNRRINCSFSGRHWWLFIIILKWSKNCCVVKADCFGGKQNIIIHMCYISILIDRVLEIYCWT